MFQIQNFNYQPPHYEVHHDSQKIIKELEEYNKQHIIRNLITEFRSKEKVLKRKKCFNFLNNSENNFDFF